MNIRKFKVLNNKISRLVDEQTILFLFKRNRFDMLRMHQLREKYPDFKEAYKENKFAILETIKELQSILDSKTVIKKGQQGIFG